MSANFDGIHTQKVDAKGRLSIPSTLRNRLISDHSRDPAEAADGAILVVQFSPDLKGHLRGWSTGSIDRARAKIRKLKSPTEREGYRYIFNTLTMEVPVDKDGRAIFKEDLRKRLNVTGGGEITFLGYDEYFEIWNAQTYGETKARDIDAFLAAKGENFDAFGSLESLEDEE